MLSVISSLPAQHPLVLCLAAAVLLPLTVVSILLIPATFAALSDDEARSNRARRVLRDLLAAIRALFRCQGGGR